MADVHCVGVFHFGWNLWVMDELDGIYELEAKAPQPRKRIRYRCYPVECEVIGEVEYEVVSDTTYGSFPYSVENR